jgi:hypothetical protein
MNELRAAPDIKILKNKEREKPSILDGFVLARAING